MNGGVGDQPMGTELRPAGPAAVARATGWQLALPTPATAPSMAPDPLSLALALKRRWRLALALGGVLGAVAVVTVLYLMPPPKYKAQAMLQVATQAPRVVLETKEATTDFKTYQKTQEAYIHSRLVLDAALAKAGVKGLTLVRKQPDPAAWLEKQIQVDYVFGSEILRIGMTSEDPKAAAMLVNAVTQAYLEEVVQAETKQRVDRQALLQENWDEYQERLRAKRDELKRLGEVAGSNDRATLAAVHQSENGRLARAEDELARVQAELRAVTLEMTLLDRQKELAARRVTTKAVEAEIALDAEVVYLTGKLAKARGLKDRASRLARNPNDGAYVGLGRELKSAQAALEARVRTIRPEIERRLAGAAREEIDMKAALAEERLNALSRQESQLSDEVKRSSGRAQVITRTAVDVGTIQDEIFAADEIARKLAVEIESLNVELQAPARVRLIQEADVPRETDRNRVVKMAGGAGMGVFALSLVAVSLWEFRGRRIESADEVEAKLGLRVVSRLPAYPERRPRQPSGSRELEVLWKSRLLDSVDAARTAILHASRQGGLRVLMVASSVGDEGKTALACHLAASLARAGRKTLLIDFDLRRPAVDGVFNLGDAPGVSEVLRGELSLRDVAIPVGNPDLMVVTAGRRDGWALGAIARDDVRLLFEEARRDYSFIVVDSAPVLQVTDALQLGQHVDAALLSVLRGESRSPDVYLACRRLSGLGIPLFGAVVSEAQQPVFGREHFFPDLIVDDVPTTDVA